MQRQSQHASAAAGYSIKVVKRDERSLKLDGKRRNVPNEREEYLHVRKVVVPHPPLTGGTRTEQVDRTKRANLIAKLLALDAVIARAPRTILRLVDNL